MIKLSKILSEIKLSGDGISTNHELFTFLNDNKYEFVKFCLRHHYISTYWFPYSLYDDDSLYNEMGEYVNYYYSSFDKIPKIIQDGIVEYVIKTMDLEIYNVSSNVKDPYVIYWVRTGHDEDESSNFCIHNKLDSDSSYDWTLIEFNHVRFYELSF